ncbi:hypothetical protein ANO11243_050440 [Dothideomycetidae sp. 11243]|nr:hypothetical protein ANO11243_050440 [fungal sp. No.11243]
MKENDLVDRHGWLAVQGRRLYGRRRQAEYVKPRRTHGPSIEAREEIAAAFGTAPPHRSFIRNINPISQRGASPLVMFKRPPASDGMRGPCLDIRRRRHARHTTPSVTVMRPITNGAGSDQRNGFNALPPVAVSLTQLWVVAAAHHGLYHRSAIDLSWFPRHGSAVSACTNLAQACRSRTDIVKDAFIFHSITGDCKHKSVMGCQGPRRRLSIRQIADDSVDLSLVAATTALTAFTLRGRNHYRRAQRPA